MTEPVKTRGAFLDWLSSAAAGSRVIYYVGDLQQELNPTGAALEAYLAYGRGEVELCQKRFGDHQYHYIAVKRKRVDPPISFADMDYVNFRIRKATDLPKEIRND